jgi:2-polyprenyl-3-methyl-5-hydroxy-6-metoxy-1,4-benzoquinol methylase
MQQQIKQEWDDVAKGSKSDPFRKQGKFFLDDNIFEIMDNVEDKSVLDLGSGNGDFAYMLSKEGAKVRGFDISDKMVELAKSKYPNIDFEKIDLEKGGFSMNEKFDYVVMELVMMFVKDADSIIKTVANSLNENGEAIVAIIHPFYIMSSLSEGLTTRVSFEGFNDYFVEQALKMKSEEVDFTYFSRSVSWYVNTFIKNGLQIIEMLEPKLGNAGVQVSSKFNLDLEMPYLLIFRLKLK